MIQYYFKNLLARQLFQILLKYSINFSQDDNTFTINRVLCILALDLVFNLMCINTFTVSYNAAPPNK